MLKAYDEYRPGMGMEVVEWIKDQTRHRQALERQKTDGSEGRLGKAQSNSFILAIIGIIAAGVIAFWSAWVAIVVAAVCVSGPSTATVVARLVDHKWFKDGPPAG